MRHPADGGTKSDSESKANVYSLCIDSSRIHVFEHLSMTPPHNLKSEEADQKSNFQVLILNFKLNFTQISN